MRHAATIKLNKAEEAVLSRMARSNTASVREARRAQIVLLAAAGKDNTEIAAAIGVGRVQVGRWRERYVGGGLAAIQRDRPRGGRKPTVDAADVVRRTTQTSPKNATHWTTRTLASAMGISATPIKEARGCIRKADMRSSMTVAAARSAPT